MGRERPALHHDSKYMYMWQCPWAAGQLETGLIVALCLGNSPCGTSCV